MSNWYLSRDQKQYGPYEWKQLQQLAKENFIVESDLIWSSEIPDWTPASQVPDLMAKPVHDSIREQVHQSPDSQQSFGGSSRSTQVSEQSQNLKEEAKGLNYQILGSVMPMVEIKLQQNERLQATFQRSFSLGNTIYLRLNKKGDRSPL